MERYSIGLDLGTSSVKGVLFSAERGITAKSTAPFTYGRSYLPDGAEYVGIDPELFYRTVCGVLRELAAALPEGGELCGVAMASASGNALLCDSEGNAMIEAYSWLNKPFKEETEAVFGKGFGEDVRERAGWGISYSFPLGQLSHIKQHAPHLLDSSMTVCMTTEYLLHRLTGKWGIDVSTATPFFLFDQKAREWNKDYLDILGIDKSKLPPLMKCGERLGEITEKASLDCGLPVGCAVHVGSFDHPTAARASGVEREGDLLISCGTSWVCFFPMNDRSAIIKGSYLSDPFLTPEGAWGAMASLARASEKIKEVVEKYIDSTENKFATLDRLAALAPVGAGGLAFNPTGELPDLSGYSRENIARALMEGIALELKKRISGAVAVSRVFMCGGPSQSKMWQRVLSETFEAPVTVTYGPHSGAVGAAMYVLKN